MDNSDGLEDLPEIILDCSISEKGQNSSFEMPDASVIAAQRKLALEQEEEIRKYKTESALVEDPIPLDLLETVNESATASLLFEHPGICLQEINKMEVMYGFDGTRSVFLMDLIEELPSCDEAALAQHLKWYFDSLELSMKENSDSFEYDDVQCNVLALCLVYLDKRCYRNVDAFRLQESMFDLLNRTGKRYHCVDNFELQTASNLTRIITHFHNRIALAHLLNNANIGKEENSEHASRKISMYISIQTLSELLGHSRTINTFTIVDLKELLVDAPKWNVLNPYEQYCMMVLVLNIMKIYSVMYSGDEKVVRSILQYVSLIKSNETWNKGEFLMVKNLVAKTKLFVQSRICQNQSPVKQNPSKARK